MINSPTNDFPFSRDIRSSFSRFIISFHPFICFWFSSALISFHRLELHHSCFISFCRFAHDVRSSVFVLSVFTSSCATFVHQCWFSPSLINFHQFVVFSSGVVSSDLRLPSHYVRASVSRIPQLSLTSFSFRATSFTAFCFHLFSSVFPGLPLISCCFRRLSSISINSSFC